LRGGLDTGGIKLNALGIFIFAQAVIPGDAKREPRCASIAKRFAQVRRVDEATGAIRLSVG
jgi:hypothetical protein